MKATRDMLRQLSDLRLNAGPAEAERKAVVNVIYMVFLAYESARRAIDDLIEFETRVNYVVPKYPNTVICAYDLTKFGASVVMDALRTHPVVIIGGLLHENPFFVSPDQFLLEIRERRSVGKSAGTAH